MVKIEIKNAKVHDSGYGLYVNYKALDRIISTALGTRAGNDTIADNDFSSDCCNVTVIIEPQPAGEIDITTGGTKYSLERLEEIRLGELTKKIEETETES